MKKILGFQEKTIITRGGKRKGSGRPKGEPTITISVRIQLKYAQELKKIIDTYKKKIKEIEIGI